MTKTKSNNVVSDFVAPIVVLTAICLVMTLLLAVTNQITSPIIDETARKRAEAARTQVMPEADGFELLSVEGLPETITEVYQATNGVGYVFMITSSGYGGKNTLNMICGIDSTGLITSASVLSHKETPGLGSKITGSNFAGQFPGKDALLDGVDTISGATFSSKYFIAAIQDAFAEYDMVKEG